MKKDLEPWQEVVSTGEVVGKDPRKMTREDLSAVGHKPMTALEALRLRCLDCCGGSVQEVRYCMARKCPSWPFRMGKSPYKQKRIVSDEARAAASERMKNLVRTQKRTSVKDAEPAKERVVAPIQAEGVDKWDAPE